MIEGLVLGGSHAVIQLAVVHPDGTQTQLDVLIDTGYTSELTLGPELIDKFGLAFTGYGTAELANGVFVETELFAAKCFWHGELRDVTVMRIDAPPLLGMEMLATCRLTIEVVSKGLVTIEQLDLP